MSPMSSSSSVRLFMSVSMSITFSTGEPSLRYLVRLNAVRAFCTLFMTMNNRTSLTRRTTRRKLRLLVNTNSPITMTPITVLRTMMAPSRPFQKS
eukprot:2184504-Prymnesium_polylepis.2